MTSSEPKSKAYYRGKRAYMYGSLFQPTNPYSEDAVEFYDFELGWLAARKEKKEKSDDGSI